MKRRAATPAGEACPGETPQERSDEEAHGPPAESVRQERKSTTIDNRAKEKGMFENELYPQIPSLLKSLYEQRFILAVATSKPTVFAEQILQYFNIHEFFDIVVGSNLDGTRSSKAEIIQYILNKYPDFKLEEFIMIGDRKHDIIGAIHTGIDSIGVTYGYGSLEEITHNKPTYIVKDIDQLKKTLMGSIAK